MQAVDRPGGQETGHRPCPAFDQQAPEPVRGQRLDDFHRVGLTVAAGDGDRRDPGRTWQIAGLDDKDRASVLSQDARIRRQPPVRVDDDAGRMVAGHLSHGQQRVVGDDRTDADDHRVDQRPQPVQMHDRLGAIDIAGIAGRGGDLPVERLSQLADDERLMAISSRYRLIEAPKRVAWIRIDRTDDVMARSKP